MKCTLSFLQQDLLSFDEILSRDLGNVFSYKLYDDMVAVQSRLIQDGIPLFIVKINRDLSFKTFHLGSQCTVKSLTKTRIDRCKNW